MTSSRTSRGRETATIHELVRDALLYDPEKSDVLRAHLEGHGSRAFRRFDRVLRSRKAYAALGLHLTEFASLVPQNPEFLSTALWVCLAMQRDGHLRQRAVAELALRAESVSLAAIINRIIDPVPDVAEQARTVWNARLPSASISQLVWCLPLIDIVCATSCAAAGVFDAVDPRLLARPKLAIRELDAATRSSDQHLRLSSFARLARLFEADLAPRLRVALNDPSPVVRLWAGRTAVTVSEPLQLEGLLDLMCNNPSPALRLLALRQYRRRVTIERIEDACFDGNANVRFYARRYLRRFRREVDHRARALAILNDPGARVRQVLGALAVLSEFGREQDRSVIDRFVTDNRAKVAAEAKRTLGLLG